MLVRYGYHVVGSSHYTCLDAPMSRIQNVFGAGEDLKKEIGFNRYLQSMYGQSWLGKEYYSRLHVEVFCSFKIEILQSPAGQNWIDSKHAVELLV